MIAGLALALGSALGTNVAFLFKQRGAVLAPPVRGRHPLRSAAGLSRSRWFSLGWAVAVVAWGLHVGALALAPLSVVQAVLSGGLVFLGVLAERYFGFHLGRRQWAGVIVTAFGLAVIAITGGRHTSAVRHYSVAGLIAVECGVFALGAGLILISMHGRFGPVAEGLLLGVAAGVLDRRALTGGAEKAVIEDFLEFCQRHFAALLPFTTLRRCAGDPQRIRRRLGAIVETLAPDPQDAVGHQLNLPDRSCVERVYLEIEASEADRSVMIWAFPPTHSDRPGPSGPTTTRSKRCER